LGSTLQYIASAVNYELSAGAMWTLVYVRLRDLHGKRKVLKLWLNHTHVAEAERILVKPPSPGQRKYSDGAYITLTHWSPWAGLARFCLNHVVSLCLKRDIRTCILVLFRVILTDTTGRTSDAICQSGLVWLTQTRQWKRQFHVH
jgi:hypothetical protein